MAGFTFKALLLGFFVVVGAFVFMPGPVRRLERVSVPTGASPPITGAVPTKPFVGESLGGVADLDVGSEVEIAGMKDVAIRLGSDEDALEKIAAGVPNGRVKGAIAARPHLGDSGIVIEVHADHAKVRVTSGDAAGKEGWAMVGWLKVTKRPG